jgi:3-oxoacyl-[acyl-carrier-protein] synthase-3
MMPHTRAAITGVSGFVPPHILSNSDLEKMVDTNDEWITTRTGIKERRILKDMTASDMGAKIVERLMEKTGLRPEEIDMIICATITGDTIMPDTANTIGYKIGAINAFGYDIGAACSGFLFALVTGSKFIETGSCKKVVVIGMDVMSAIIDYTDRSTCIILVTEVEQCFWKLILRGMESGIPLCGATEAGVNTSI